MGDAIDPGAVRFSVLGSLQVSVDGAPARIRPGHPEHLLAVLLAAQGDFVSVEQLIDRLWGDRPPSAATSTLHSHVRAVRSALGEGAGVIANERGRGYRIRFAPVDPNGATCDLLEFRAHVAAARELVRTDELDAARTELRCALDLWRGDAAFPELIDDLDARSLVVELTSLREWAEQQAVDLAMRSGDPAVVIPDLEAALARDPADQRTAARLMRAYASSGRPERASAVYAGLVRLLRDRSGDVPLPELAELDGRILRHDPEIVALGRPGPPGGATPPPPMTIVPELGAELTSFVGRTAEIDRLADALAASRVVTVVGAGGCGKTRLAREVARRVAPAGGVALAQLAEVAEGDSSGVVEQVARSVGSGARSGDELAAELAAVDRDLLVVFDNCEHVLEPVALLAVALLERCPSMRVLVTSREALHLPGERVVPLPPMATVGAETSGGGGPTEGAVLFVTRAVDAGWRVDHEEVLADPVQLRTIESICARLDGLPLAIELVAPLAGMYTLDDLDGRLVDQPDVARSVRSPHLRQRTLGEVIEWSVSRLSEHEHAALLTASVFAGPFTPAAFEAVASEVWTDAFDGDWLVLLDALVGRSLLSPRSEGGGTRFRLLETIRAHTRRAARARDLAGPLAAAHARHFASAAAGSSVDGDRADQRAALLWCIDTGDDDLGIELLDGVGIHMYRLALPPSVVAWLERLGAGHGPTAAIALDLRAMHALFSGDYEQLDRIADRAVAALREAGEDRRAAKAGVVAAFSYVLADDTDEAERLLADARAGDDLDDWLASWADAVEGLLARRAGRLDEAERHSAQALAAFTARGDRFGALLPTLNLGRIHCDRGDLDIGLAQLDRGIRVAEALGDHLIQTLGHAYAARVLLTSGDAAAAVSRLIAGLATARHAPNRVLVASLLDYAAGALAALGDHESAARLVGAAAAQRPGGVVDPLGLAVPARDGLGAGFEAAVAVGGALEHASAIDLAVGRLAGAAGEPSANGG